MRLAIHGGTREVDVSDPHIIWPAISESCIELVERCLRSGMNQAMCTDGIAEFEAHLRDYFDSTHALSFNSGTSALLALYKGLGLEPNDEVVAPALTFFGTVTPLLHLGVRPVLVDADDRGQVDLAQVESSFTDRTRALVVTHMWGYSTDVEALERLCDAHDVALVEDIAHAPGAVQGGRLLGTFGVAASGSLHGEKTLSGGEGGYLVTRSKALFDEALFASNFNRRTRSETGDDYARRLYALTGYGIKNKIHPLAAIIASDQLRSLPSIVERRDAVARRLIAALDGAPGVRCIAARADERPSWHSAILCCTPTDGGPDRDGIVAAIQAEGALRVDAPGANRPLSMVPLFNNPQEMFRDADFSYSEGDFPSAETFWASAIQVPVFVDPVLADAYERAICKVISNLDQVSELSEARL